jgi:DNA-binding NarL/FixJ family response regulator
LIRCRLPGPTYSLVPGGHTAASLTQRQREVLVLVAKGESNQDIADTLGISEPGVDRAQHVFLAVDRHDVGRAVVLNRAC